MTNDQQQVEALRSEFINLVKSKNQYHNCMWYTQKEKFQNPQIHFAWDIFLMAKRNQPVIELPVAQDMYDAGGSWLGRFWAEGYVHNAITAAGYSYKVK